jgi:Flp pilus assembly CpaE family ATPase
MYSLKINLVGCDEETVPPAAREILQRWAVIDDDYPNVTALQKKVLMKEGETRLIVIHINSANDISELKRLNSLYPRYPILAVVDASSDSTLVMKCMRAGALQVVHPPVLPDDLLDALDCIAAKHEGLSKIAKLVAIAPSVGGCGGTTVAINVAYELGRLAKERSILMELSLRKGVLADYLNIAPRYTTTSLIADIGRVDSFILQGALTEVAENFSVFVGPYESIQTEKPDLDSTMQLVQLTRHLAASVVLDIPSTYDDLFFRCLLTADRIVLVADQSVAAIRGAQMVCDSLGQHRPIVLINRYNPKLSGLSCEKIQGFLPGCEICALENDLMVAAAMNNGKPLRLHSPRSRALGDLDALIKKIAASDPKDGGTEAKQSIMSRLGHALSLS